jgi:hypothetical protein
MNTYSLLASDGSENPKYWVINIIHEGRSGLDYEKISGLSIQSNALTIYHQEEHTDFFENLVIPLFRQGDWIGDFDSMHDEIVHREHEGRMSHMHFSLSGYVMFPPYYLGQFLEQMGFEANFITAVIRNFDVFWRGQIRFSDVREYAPDRDGDADVRETHITGPTMPTYDQGRGQQRRSSADILRNLFNIARKI